MTRPGNGEADAKVTLIAEIVYGTEKLTKEFEVIVSAMSETTGIEYFDRTAVEVTDEYYDNALELDAKNLLALDADRLLGEDLSLEKDGENPQILIYHTHSQETFADYGPDRPDATVVGIGEYLTELLEEMGYRVIHDTTVYDLIDGELDRSRAYDHALKGITAILQQNPSVQVILDIHRDGVREDLHMVSEVNGKPTAPIMFFNGMSQTPEGAIEYLPNPYKEQNLAFSLQMQLDAAAYYPGLTRKIYLKAFRYNLHLRPRSALIEVGAQTNTYEEARNAMEPLSRLLDMVLNPEEEES